MSRKLEELSQAVHDATDALRRAQHAYLEAAGWQLTCYRSVWLWEKTMPEGYVARLPLPTAITMQLLT